MVQAGVNPFTVSPGYSAAQTLNASDNNLHVAVGVKNDPLSSSVKQDTGVSITSNLSLAQVIIICLNSFIYWIM